MSRIHDALQRAKRSLEESPVPVARSETAALADVPSKRVQVPAASRLAFHSDPDGPGADRIRYLRMLLTEQAGNGRLRTLLITSPLPGDGKSTIALNLAAALAEEGRSAVAFLEADYYHPTIGGVFGLESARGLAGCLEDGMDPVEALCRIEPLGLYCMPAGRPTRNPAELLQSDALSRAVNRLRSLFDWVVMDSPPLLPVSDALLLSRHADASLLIVRAGRTPGSNVEEALARLGSRHVLGIVLNAAEDISRRYGHYYGYYRRNGAEASGPV